jgi:hypothetical protein
MRREAGAGAARRMIRAFTLMALALVGVALGVAHKRGLPDGVARVIMAAIAGPQCAVEAGRVQLSGLQNVRVEGLKVYAKGVVGPAGFECDRAVVRCSLVRALRGKGLVEELHVNQVILRPAFLRPRIEPRGGRATGGALGGRGGRGSYRLSAAMFECAGVRLRDLSCDVDPEALRITARNVRCRVGEAAEGTEPDCRGELLIDAAARTVSGRFETAFDPVGVIPILRFYGLDFTCELINRFGFGSQKPRSEFTFVDSMDAPSDLHADAKLWMENCRYRGVDVMRGDAVVVIDVAPQRTRVSLSPLVVSRPEGVARVDLTVDASEGLVSFNGTSSMDPRALTRLIGIFTNTWADAVVAEGSYRIDSTGVADLRGDSRQFIRTSVRGGRFGVGRFVADEAAFTVLTQGATSRVEQVTGMLYGGTVEGSGLVVAPRDGADAALRYHATGSVRGADFEQLVATARPELGLRELSGRMSLNLDIEGPLGTNWWSEVRGSGDVEVREGRVFMLPVFGGLSGYLARIIPGVDFMLTQRDFSSAFVLEQRRIRSDRISVEGSVLSLQGKGSCGFDRTLDVAVQVKLLKDDPLIAKVVRLITWPLSKLFEFRLTGTLDAPRWYPVNFSGELLEKLGLKNGKDERAGDDIQP